MARIVGPALRKQPGQRPNRKARFSDVIFTHHSDVRNLMSGGRMRKWLSHEALRALRSPIDEAEFKVTLALLALANKNGEARVGLKRLSALSHIHRTTLRRVLKRMSGGVPFASHTQNERNPIDDENWVQVTYQLLLTIEEPETWSGADVARVYTLTCRKMEGKISRVAPRVHRVHRRSTGDTAKAGIVPSTAHDGEGPRKAVLLRDVDPPGVRQAHSRGSVKPTFEASEDFKEESEEVDATCRFDSAPPGQPHTNPRSRSTCRYVPSEEDTCAS